jgi:geranylgeranyl diphosphate synthase type II
MNFSNLARYLDKTKILIDNQLHNYLSQPGEFPKLVYDSMRYATFPGGKRIRPVLTIATAEMCGLPAKKVLPVACAIELIHTYSLIHDDLPAMDNDNYRRGKPTVHKKYNECIGILAGDAVLTKAFELMTYNARLVNPGRVIETIRLLAVNAGVDGMVGGQVLDTLGIKGCGLRQKDEKKLVEQIHLKKTGALLKSSVVAGALLAGATKKQLRAVEIYGTNIGLAFQIIDDVFDKDINRLTYPGLYGIEKSKLIAGSLIASAKHSIEIFRKKSIILSELADYIIYRKE